MPSQHQDQNHQNTSASGNQTDDSVKMKSIWLAMTAMYGPKFQQTFGPMGAEAYQLWKRNLSRITIDQAQWALDYFSKQDRQFPPTLGEFHSACLQTPKKKEPKALPSAPCSRMVMMIESFKQHTLYGYCAGKTGGNREYTEDWEDSDTTALKALIKQWDKDTGHRGLCELIDNYQFSHGSINERLGKPKGSLLCDTFKAPGVNL